MSVEERIAALEARLRAAEDHLAILNLLNSYGPLVDSGSGAPAADLWVQGGTYNHGMPDGTQGLKVAPDELVAMYASEGHMGLVGTGCAHLTAPPKVTIDGDTATAVGYSFVILREGERWYVWRAAVNEWALVRTNVGWRVQERLNRTLDGSPESLDVMRRVAAI